MSSVEPIFIVGPTACGKSAVALALAAQTAGEIITVDSMQVYRGLDIGTAKPTAAERARVPHHLIDIADLGEPFDAAKFVAMARKAVEDIRFRSRRPIFCGGTGLYLKAYLEGLGAAPPGDATLRKELEATPLEELLHELAARDPVTYGRIDRENPRRIVRAIEVIRLTGKPFSEQRAAWNVPGRRGEGFHDKGEKGKVDHGDGHSLPTSPSPPIYGLRRANEDLHARINARVDDMFARGLVEETRTLLQRGLEHNRTALQALGYRQVIDYLHGERSLSETVGLVKVRTRQFAKRQMTWFRRQLDVTWIDVASGDAPEAVAARLARGK